MLVDTGFIPSKYKGHTQLFYSSSSFLRFVPKIRVDSFRHFTTKFQVTKQNAPRHRFQVIQTTASKQSLHANLSSHKRGKFADSGHPHRNVPMVKNYLKLQAARRTYTQLLFSTDYLCCS
jgi:DNA-binding MurR/RpiR family transcriptional regulator